MADTDYYGYGSETVPQLEDSEKTEAAEAEEDRPSGKARRDPMLRGARALDLALELTRHPTLAVAMREQSLPSDTLVVIRIAAGCSDTVQEAMRSTGAPAETLKEAAVLYLQKVLLAPDSDCYRVLGVQPDAPREQDARAYAVADEVAASRPQSQMNGKAYSPNGS